MDRDLTRSWMIFEDLLASCLWQTSHQPGWQTVFEENKNFLQYFHLHTAVVSERQVPGLLIRSEWNSLYNESHTKRVGTRTSLVEPSKDFTGFLLGFGRSASGSLGAEKGSELSHFIVVDCRAIADYLSANCVRERGRGHRQHDLFRSARPVQWEGASRNYYARAIEPYGILYNYLIVA